MGGSQRTAAEREARRERRKSMPSFSPDVLVGPATRADADRDWRRSAALPFLPPAADRATSDSPKAANQVILPSFDRIRSEDKSVLRKTEEARVAHPIFSLACLSTICSSVARSFTNYWEDPVPPTSHRNSSKKATNSSAIPISGLAVLLQSPVVPARLY